MGLRRIYFDGDVAYIPLANARGVAKVDVDDVGAVAHRNWFACNGYAATVNPRPTRNQVLMHSVILGRAPSGFEWDHRNRDRLDNRRENLRLATHSQNLTNSKGPNRTGYKGTGLLPSGRYRAQIRINHNQIKHLGTYDTAEAAARAYDAAAKEHHGDFAVLNFPCTSATPR